MNRTHPNVRTARRSTLYQRRGVSALLCAVTLIVLAAAASAQETPRPLDRTLIRLKGFTFDPLEAVPKHRDLPAITAYQTGVRGGYLVQFDQPISESERTALEQAGASVKGYLPAMTLEVVMSEQARAAVEALPGVRWVGPYQPSFKLRPEFLDRANANPEASLRLQVSVFPGEGTRALAALAARGARVLRHERGRSFEVFEVEAAANLLSTLSQIPQVRYIEPVYQKKMNNDRARLYTGISAIADDTFLNGLDPSLDGEGGGFRVKYGHFDGGIQRNHADFGTARVTVERGFDTSNDAHGTHTAGSIIGDGASSLNVPEVPPGSGAVSENRWRGVTPQAALHHIPFTSEYTDRQIFEREVEVGAQISTNSWVHCEEVFVWCFPITDYTVNSALWDEGVWDADDDDSGQQPLIAFFAAGNSGAGDNGGCATTGDQVASPGNAKNVITVGANETDRGCGPEGDNVGDMAFFSSRGPVDPDATGVGLFKPDVTNIGGGWILSSESTGSGGSGQDDPNSCSDTGSYYRYSTGTSMSTPLTAGLGGIVLQDLVVNLNVSNPKPSLVKALFINGAISLQPSGDCSYGFERDQASIGQGWGMVNARNSLYGPGGNPTQRNVAFENEIDLNAVATGEVYTREITASADRPLKVTLVWTDYPAAPGSGSPLVVNDLDLEVSGPDGTYLGNNFSGNWSVTGGTPDRYNVVENVYIEQPAGGAYTITIRGFQVSQDQEPNKAGVNQDFSLAWSGDLGACPDCPVETIHDIAVASINTFSDAYVNVPQDVSVGVTNEGTEDETFTVTVTDSLPATIDNNNQVVTLAAGASTSLTFTWTPALEGSHVLTATVGTISGETDTADNTKSSAAISVVPLPDQTTRMNTGGADYTDSLGQAWSADSGATGGSPYSTGSSISNTDDPALYQSVRYGAFSYQLPLANGSYLVRLKFAEVYFSQAGQRVFDVAINGQTVLSSFDAVAEAGASLTAVDRQFGVDVTGNQMSIDFIPVVGDPAVNAIEILPIDGVLVSVSPTSVTLSDSETRQFTASVVGSSNTDVTWSIDPQVGTISSSGLYTAPGAISAAETVTVTVTSVADPSATATATVSLEPVQPPDPVRVNAGGSQYTDSLGQSWSADTGFSGGSTWGTSNTISGTDDPALYQKIRYGTFEYQFPVSNGLYLVNLKFAEVYFSQPGNRVFDVLINGQTVLSSFDAVAEAGAAFTAIDKQIPVDVTDGQIRVQFTRIASDPAINAIEIVPVSGVLVTVSPTSAGLSASDTQQFTASVYGASNTDVTWSISPEIGSISSSGLYTAPSTLLTEETVAVTATSVADPAATATATISLTPPELAEPIRVNSGSSEYTDSLGQVWSADTGYSGGFTHSTGSDISGTDDPTLYKTIRYGNFEYRFTVEDGAYLVNLKFAELYFSQPGGRVFDVLINGQTVLSGFDAVAEAGGSKVAVDRLIPVEVSTGEILIQFAAVAADPAINAIEITPLEGTAVIVSPASATLTVSQTQQFTAAVFGNEKTDVTWSLNPVVGTISASGLYTAPTSIPNPETVTVTATSVADPSASDSATLSLTPEEEIEPIRVNSGGSAYTDSQGGSWSADTAFSGGATYATGANISGTDDPTLYKSVRYGTFQYGFPVNNGSYTVTLKFAEVYFSQPGNRVFDVVINGQTVLSSFDAVAEAGARYIAVDRAIPVTVSNGEILIQFTRVVGDPAINAIEITSQ